MNNGRTGKKFVLLLIFAILVMSFTFSVTSAQDEKVIDINTEDVWEGVGMLLAPTGSATELVQARLIAFVMLTIILVPTLSKVPLFSS